MISTETALDVAISDLGKLTLEINRANGWDVATSETWDGPNPDKIPRMLALAHSELSEALEAYRKGDKDNFVEELADTVIRVVDLSAGLGLDLAGAIVAKLKKNRERGHKHGGKRI